MHACMYVRVCVYMYVCMYGEWVEGGRSSLALRTLFAPSARPVTDGCGGGVAFSVVVQESREKCISPWGCTSGPWAMILVGYI